MRPHRLALAAIALLACSACKDLFGSKSAQINPELRRTTSSAASLLAGVGSEAQVASVAAGAPGSVPWSSAFTISSFRVPIRAINIAHSVAGSSAFTNAATVYDCAADSNAGCLVELIGANLDDILGASPRSVGYGSYDVIAVQSCKTEGAYTAYLTGSVVIGGTRYYTKPASGLSPTGPAEAVAITYQGCSRNLPIVGGGFSVADSVSGALTLRLYVDTRDIAWGTPSLGATSGAWFPGSCTPVYTGGAFVCTGYPDVVGTLGSAAPTVERYRVNGGATFGFLFDGLSGQPLGGYSRPYFAEDQPNNTGITAASPFRTVNSMGTGVLSVEGYGSGAVGQGSFFTTTSFQRATHSGTYTTSDTPTPRPYSAVRLP